MSRPLPPPSPAIEAKLRERFRALVAREAKLAVHLRAEDGRREVDSDDALALLANDEVIEGLDAAARHELREIGDALSRIRAGTFGRCVRCGKAIAPARLEAMPHAAT